MAVQRILGGAIVGLGSASRAEEAGFAGVDDGSSAANRGLGRQFPSVAAVQPAHPFGATVDGDVSGGISTIAQELTGSLTAISICINALQKGLRSGQTEATCHAAALTLAADQVARSAEALHRLHDVAAMMSVGDGNPT